MGGLERYTCKPGGVYDCPELNALEQFIGLVIDLSIVDFGIGAIVVAVIRELVFFFTRRAQIRGAYEMIHRYHEMVRNPAAVDAESGKDSVDIVRTLIIRDFCADLVAYVRYGMSNVKFRDRRQIERACDTIIYKVEKELAISMEVYERFYCSLKIIDCVKRHFK